MKAEHRSRLQLLREMMNERALDLLFVVPSCNMRYLSGISGSYLVSKAPNDWLTGLFVPRTGDLIFVVSSMHRDFILRSGVDAPVVTWTDGDDGQQVLKDVLGMMCERPGRIGVDDDARSRLVLGLKDLLPDCQLIPASSLLFRMRKVKGTDEVAAMRRSAQVVEEVLADVLRKLTPSVTERQVAAMVLEGFAAGGAEGASFDPIVRFGENSGRLGDTPTSRALRTVDVVQLDIGCRVDGYCSDITRTVAVGEIDPQFEQVYRIVQQAQEEAFRAVRPGMAAAEVDSVARGVITTAGYGDRFLHRTGHGIGMEGHEPPYISRGDTTILEPGMAFSIEPGIYLPDRFGVRIEDVVVVGEDSAERLTNYPRELEALYPVRKLKLGGGVTPPTSRMGVDSSNEKKGV